LFLQQEYINIEERVIAHNLCNKRNALNTLLMHTTKKQ
jgi:hypothetical protein